MSIFPAIVILLAPIQKGTQTHKRGASTSMVEEVFVGGEQRSTLGDLNEHNDVCDNVCEYLGIDGGISGNKVVTRY